MNKKIYIQANQSLWDISLQEYGSIEGVFYILEANTSLDINSQLVTGDLILIPERAPLNKKVVDYYNSLKITSTSGSYSITSTVTCDGVSITNSNNTFSTNVPSGGSLSVSDSNIILDKDYEGLELLKSLPATNNLTLSVVDENDNKLALIYSDGDKIVIEDILIRNSNNSFNQLISLVNNNQLLDVSHTDSNGNQVSTPAMIPFICSPTPDSLYNPIKTGGQSHLIGDNGATQAGRNLDVDTLDFTNPYGNNIRITNDLGGDPNDNSDGSTVDYIVDNSSKLGYKKSYGTTRTMKDHCLFAPSLTIGSYTGFRPANFLEYSNVQEPHGLLPYISIFGNPSSDVLLINKLKDINNCYRVINATAIYIYPSSTSTPYHTLFVRNHIY